MNVLFDPKRVSVEEALERLCRAGFEVLDFNLCDWLFEGSPFVGEGWEKWVSQIAQTAKRLGITFSQAHGPIFNKFEDSEKARWMTQMCHRSFEACAILEVRWMVLEPESFPGPFDEEHQRQLLQRNLDWFGEMLPTAEKTGVGIAIENTADIPPTARGFRRAFGSVPSELIQLVDALDSPLVGICWDTGHAHIQRLDQPSALSAIGKRLKATHIQDNNGEQDQHLLPFHGTIDWQGIIARLQDIGYEGDFVYEVHNSIRPLPDELRDSALRYAVEIGRFLLDRSLRKGGR